MCETCEWQDQGNPVSRRALLTGGTVGLGGVIASQFLPATASAKAAKPTLPYRGTELVILGTAAGPPPEPDRAGIASALHVRGKNYLIDCGRSSVTQYFNAGLAYLDLDSIFITHLHADHICDYYNVFLLAGWGVSDFNDQITQRVRVFGPGPAGALQPAFNNRSTATINPADPTPGLIDMTERLIDAYAYSTNVFLRDSGIPDPRSLMDLTEIAVPNVGASPLGPTAPSMAPFTVMEDDRVRVSAILVPHGPVFPCFAFRFDTDDASVVFSGDTSLSDNVVRLATGADVLVHEAIDLQALGALPPAVLDHLQKSHTSVDDVGAVAERAGVRTLVLSHLVPSSHSIVSDQEWRRRAQAGFTGKVIVGEDLMRLRLRRGARHARP